MSDTKEIVWLLGTHDRIVHERREVRTNLPSVKALPISSGYWTAVDWEKWERDVEQGRRLQEACNKIGYVLIFE